MLYGLAVAGLDIKENDHEKDPYILAGGPVGFRRDL
jgi:hypothetical protein